MEKIKLSQVSANPNNPRQSFDPVEMTSLEESVKAQGILLPLVVMKKGEKNYILLDGERRYRVAKSLGLKEIPVEILPMMDDKEQVVTMFQIQEQHKNWTPFDKARAIYFFMDTQKLSQRSIAQLLGLSQSHVNAWLEILKLSKNSQSLAVQKRIPFSYLNRIVRISQYYQEITNKSLPEIEELLIAKVESHALRNQADITQLSRIMRVEGDEAKKIKFLTNKNYTFKNLSDQTPAGNSVKLDILINASRQLRARWSKLLTVKDSGKLTDAQERSLKELVEVIEKII